MANSTTVDELVDEASQATRPKLLAATLANTATRRVPEVVDHVCRQASEATRANLAIAPSADAAAGYETVSEARETVCSHLLVAAMADCTSRRLLEVVDHVRREASETPRANLRVTALTDAAAAHESITETCETTGAKLRIAPTTHTTAWRCKVIVNEAREAARLHFAPTPPAI